MDRQFPLSTVRGSIRQFNYGPEGEVAGVLLSSGTLVSFSPELSNQVADVAKPKSELTATGYQRQSVTGKVIFTATTITLNGQTFGVPSGAAPDPNAPPPPPPPPSGGDPAPPRN